MKSICPIIGGIKFLNRFKYGSVTCLNIAHGCLIQFTFGNQVKSTLTNSKSKYNFMNDATDWEIRETIFLSTMVVAAIVNAGFTNEA